MLAVNIDSSGGQLAADGAVLLVVAIEAVLGWRYGLVRRCLVLFGMFAAGLAATFAGNTVAAAVHPHSVAANAVAFAGVFAAIVILFEMVGALYHERLRGLAVVAFDRVAGGAAGALLGILMMAVLFRAVLALGDAAATGAAAPGHGEPARVIRSATLSGAVVAVEPGVSALFSPVVPPNLDSHLEETAQGPTAG